jgi:hypothetical protein
MGVSKLVLNGVTEFDISEDTVTASKLGKGITAHNSAGELITGTMEEGLDTSDATASTNDILSGKTAYVDGTKITGSLANVTQDIILSDKTAKIIDKGYHDGTGTVKVSDSEAAKIISSNIKSGVTIFGVTGTVDEGVDTSDATATAENILNGATAYVNGEKVTGTMPENSTTTTEITTANQVVTVAKGYHTGGDTISISSVDQANIIASNIKKNVTILGVTGTVEEGTKINAQSKTVSPTFAAQEVTPDEDYNALSSVTVKSIPVSEEVNDYGGETLIIGEQGSSVEDILKVYIEKGTLDRLPSDLTSIRDYAFYRQTVLALTSLPNKVDSIGDYAFYNCTGLTSITFKGTPTTIASTVFDDCTNLKDIYVPWAEGAVANAPWGAIYATIHYDSTV